ncbi:hypothetical protein ACJ41O_014850 [Fusarium nematophilum]
MDSSKSNKEASAILPGTNMKVVVVGAGIAGLHTAAILISHGFEVVVLEARDRIGGRILTDHNDPDCIDLGAAWMHATAYNPLVKLISKLGIDYYYDDGSPLYFTEFGPAGPNFKARNVTDEFIDYLNYWLQKNPDGPDSSAEEHIRKFVQQHELITDDERNWAPEALRIVEDTLGLPLNEISSMFLNEMLPPSRDLYVKGGYDKVVNFIAQTVVGFPGTLRCGHIVDQIKWNLSEGDAAVVHAHDAINGDRISVSGDAVVVTVPLGVLHQNKINFQPPLPTELATGISKMSYGALGKVIFEFTDVFWSKHNDNLIYIPTPASLAEGSESHKYPVLSHCFVVTNLWVMTGAKKLCILLSPPVVHEIEKMEGNQEQLFDYFEPLLELFRSEPYKALPNMVEAKTTSWTRDEFAGFGTYSTARVGDDPRILWDALQANKDLRLQFAGEHCSRTGTGCVHGAYETAEVAAENIIEMLSKKSLS